MIHASKDVLMDAFDELYYCNNIQEISWEEEGIWGVGKYKMPERTNCMIVKIIIKWNKIT